MDDFLEELRRTFLLEGQELLEQIEKNLVHLDPNQPEDGMVEELFRDFHTLKGNSRSVNYPELAELTHKIENILTKIKQGDLKFTPAIIDCLLESKDVLLSDLEVLASGSSRLDPHLDLIEKIEQAVLSSPDEVAQGHSTALKDLKEAMEETQESHGEYGVQAEFNHDPSSTFESSPDEVVLPPKPDLDHAEIMERKVVDQIMSDVEKISRDTESLNHVLDPTPPSFGIFDQDLLDHEPSQAEPIHLHRPDRNLVLAQENESQHEVQVHVNSEQGLNIGDQKPQKEKTLNQDEYIRVSLAKVNELVALSREQAGLLSILDYMAAQGIHSTEDLLHQINQLVDQTFQLQKVAISLRMVTLDTIEAKLQRVVHDTCKTTQKKVKLKVSGTYSEVEKGILDPLVHMVRNAIDHGIETPEERQQLKKPEHGEISINTYAKGGFVFIELKDDGKGLNRKSIVEKAKKLGLLKVPESQLADWQVFQLIFEAGFSTKEQITEVSGRGVGMDVVRSEVNRLNGRIDIRSQIGQGTNFIIRLPLPIATFNGVLVSVGSSRYILPNSEIEAIHVVKPKDIVRFDRHRYVVDLGNESLTLLNLMNEESLEGSDKEKLCILQVSHHGKKFGLLVEEVLESRKYTYKKLGNELDDLPGVSGGAILGDGKVCLILNATDLIETSFQMVA